MFCYREINLRVYFANFSAQCPKRNFYLGGARQTLSEEYFQKNVSRNYWKNNFLFCGKIKTFTSKAFEDCDLFARAG
jgi:hypothetical protein